MMRFIFALLLVSNFVVAQTVVDVVVNSEDHTTLEAAVVAAGLVETLSGEGPFTVFAPTDAAFAALPAGTIDALLADPTGDLTQILLYHALGATVLSSDLSDGQTAATLNGEEITVTINDGGVFINDAKVTVADIETENGVVHVIDAILMPPSLGLPYIFDIIADSDDHTILETAIIAADGEDGLSSLSDGTFTFFAPTDAAFEALPEGTIEALLADPFGDLIEVLSYHLFKGTLLSSDLSDGQILSTYYEEEIVLTINDEGIFLNNAKVTVADIEAKNGVVHVIDAVLLPPTKPASVVEVVVNSEDHTTLEAAVVAAGLVETLSGEGPFTVFAPTDAAFAALPAGTIDALLADPTGDLTQILLYHVLGATVLSSDLSDGQTAATLNGKEITVTINDEGVFINDAKVTVADIETDNGVVHVIDAVLLPPPTKPASVVEVIVNSEDHTTLEAAVVAAGLVETLSGEGPFTVFAPTDAAFAALPAGTIDALLADPTGDLTQILLYHVLGATVLSSDLSDGQTAATLNGKDITVTINDDGVFINDAKVTVADIETDNGVVHVIDAVLDPTMVNIINIESTFITAFPNPVTEKLNIETINENDIIETLYVYNSTGSLVANFNNLVGVRKSIDVGELTKGSYNIVFTVNDKNYSKTFIKQ